MNIYKELALTMIQLKVFAPTKSFSVYLNPLTTKDLFFRLRLF